MGGTAHFLKSLPDFRPLKFLIVSAFAVVLDFSLLIGPGYLHLDPTCNQQDLRSFTDFCFLFKFLLRRNLLFVCQLYDVFPNSTSPFRQPLLALRACLQLSLSVLNPILPRKACACGGGRLVFLIRHPSPSQKVLIERAHIK